MKSLFNHVYNLLLSSKRFNQYNLISKDHDLKLEGILNNKGILIYNSPYDKKWSIQLLICDIQTEYDEYKYIDHLNFKLKPNRFKTLFIANKLIKKNLNKIK